MSEINAHRHSFRPTATSRLSVIRFPISKDEADLFALEPTQGANGRSNWVCAKLPGDKVIFGAFPQGEVYFDLLERHFGTRDRDRIMPLAGMQDFTRVAYEHEREGRLHLADVAPACEFAQRLVFTALSKHRPDEGEASVKIDAMSGYLFPDGDVMIASNIMGDLKTAIEMLVFEDDARPEDPDTPEMG